MPVGATFLLAKQMELAKIRVSQLAFAHWEEIRKVFRVFLAHLLQIQ